MPAARSGPSRSRGPSPADGRRARRARRRRATTCSTIPSRCVRRSRPTRRRASPRGRCSRAGCDARGRGWSTTSTTPSRSRRSSCSPAASRACALVVALSLDRLRRRAARRPPLRLRVSETQRDLWTRRAAGRSALLDPARYDADPTLRSVLDVVPFGVPDDAAGAAGPGRARALPQLAADDEVVLWNGGLWAWLDAGDRDPRGRAARASAARACGSCSWARRRAGRARAGEEARALADALGAAGRGVSSTTAGCPTPSAARWLLDADCAISTHVDHLETRFAFRTRLLDCFWAGLPVVCTARRRARRARGARRPRRSRRAGRRRSARGRAGARAGPRHATHRGRARAGRGLRWSRVTEPLSRSPRGGERVVGRAAGAAGRAGPRMRDAGTVGEARRRWPPGADARLAPRRNGRASEFRRHGCSTAEKPA